MTQPERQPAPARRAPREVTIEIDEIDGAGLGVGHHEGKPLHVRGALPGETVVVRILKKRRGRLYGDAVEVVSDPSHLRKTSACEVFPRCGGCSLHHMDYAAQLQLKDRQLRQALANENVQPRRFRAPQSAVQLGYRRKARLGVRALGEQVLVGFRESFSNRVARLSACPVLTPQLSGLLQPLRQTLARLSQAARIPQIEVAQGDGQPALMIRHLEPMSDHDIELLRAFERDHQVTILLQSGGYDTVTDLDGGQPSLLSYQMRESGTFMPFDPRQFTQVNQPMNEVLVSAAQSYLGELAGLRVTDLFCGIGNFSLPAARSGAFVHGLELDDTAVQRARANAALNGLAPQCEFSAVDLYSSDAEIPDADALLLDPPRSGAGANLERWLSSGTYRQIVYVSCNPESFAADAAIICAQGFVLEAVGAYDMFPNTTHVETLGYFRAGDQSAHG